MKEGRTLQELATEIERQSTSKHDYLVRSDKAYMSDRDTLSLMNGEVANYALKPLAHEQLADKLSIPRKYYQRLQKDFPELLVSSVNTLLPATTDSLLVRTLDGNARAILSNRFRCLDNKPLMENILPPLIAGGFKVVSSELTDTRFYLKVISEQFEADLGHLGVVRGGFWFRNSEVGYSQLAGGLFLEVLACTNGMMFTKDYGFAKNHAGKAIDFADAVESYFSIETRALDDRAYWAKVRDVVGGMVGSREGFQDACQKIMRSANDRLDTSDIVRLSGGVQETFALTNEESNGVLQYLMKGGDMSCWGLANALTRYSQDVPDYDRATDFEEFGADIIELNPSQYRDIPLEANRPF